MLGVATILITVDSMDTQQDRAQAIGRMIIPVAFCLYGANRAWKSLLGKEPESNPLFRIKHRRFQLASAICMGVVLTSSLSYGVARGSRIQQTNKVTEIIKQLAELTPKANSFRQRLGDIRSKETPTMQDYYDQCLAVESLLNEFEPVRVRGSAILKAAREAFRDEERFTKIFELRDKIDQSDSAVFAALRNEISKELIRLPPERQPDFYEREIIPIQKQIDELAAAQISLLRDARDRGIKLPPELSDLVKP